MQKGQHNFSYTKFQLFFLVVLRVLIGWHFLYEGLAKLVAENWTSLGFLLDSKGPFANIFISLASSPETLKVINFLNIYGLIAIGLSLILGLFTRTGCLAGIILLAFYYLSHPPFIGYSYMVPSEGSYLWVNKNLIELFALALIYVFPSGHIIGLDRFISILLKKNMNSND
jgi:thiosulfate dehydrogenase [quinone] large subunit